MVCAVLRCAGWPQDTIFAWQPAVAAAVDVGKREKKRWILLLVLLAGVARDVFCRRDDEKAQANDDGPAHTHTATYWSFFPAPRGERCTYIGATIGYGEFTFLFF
jgi:hypothetical protein